MSQSRKKLTIQTYYDKLQKLQVSKSKLNPLNQTSENFKVLSPKLSSNLSDNRKRTQHSMERSPSHPKSQLFILHSTRQISHRNLAENHEMKITKCAVNTTLIQKHNSLSPSKFDIKSLKEKLNEKFLEESKNNNSEICLQLLEPTLAHNYFINLYMINQKISPDLIASVNAKDDQKFSALHYAVKNKNIQYVSALIYKQCEIDAENFEGVTPLQFACYIGNAEIANMLINAGANINHQDKEGNTCLHYGCQFNRKEIVSILLQNKKILLKQNKDKKYPDYYINDPGIAQLFIQFRDNKQSNYQEDRHIQIQNISSDMISRIFLNKSPKKMQTPINNKFGINLQQQAYFKKHLSPEQKNEKYQYKQTNTMSTNTDSMMKNSSKNELIYPEQFKIIGLIGKGSFGEVYLVCKDKELFAMKVLQKSLIIKQNIEKYVLAERNVLSQTNHPFIVKLRYAFQTQDKLFLIQDYCIGGDLGLILSKQKRLPEKLVKLYLCEIILALEDLHQRDIIYRDLKPDNIIIDSEGHALLTDFGLSKEGVFEPAVGAKSFCGSVAYLAPEMLKKSGHGKSVDWYLLGVVMYELLCGLPPYYANDREELFYNIQNAGLNIPSYISNDGKNLLKSLLQRNPMKRLGSGRGDADEIKNHPYFKDIDWIKVYNRQLELPKPEKRIRINTDQNQNVFEVETYIEKEKSHLQGWTFIN